jgi:hypothetical protein
MFGECEHDYHIQMRLVGTCDCLRFEIVCYTLFWARFIPLRYVVKVVTIELVSHMHIAWHNICICQ